MAILLHIQFATNNAHHPKHLETFEPFFFRFTTAFHVAEEAVMKERNTVVSEIKFTKV